MNSLISTREAAKRLNVSIRRVQALIASGRLPAEKIGNSFAIKELDLNGASTRKNGRPNRSKPPEKDWNAILDEIIGSVSIGPDLSTNKEHLEGYGRK